MPEKSTMKSAEYYLMDVFTDRPFAGNQLAIFPDAKLIPEDQLAAITRELNLSECVFIYPAVHPDADIRMRIFTPGTELPTAGHPTIGTAIFLASRQPNAATLKTHWVLEQPIGRIKVALDIEQNAPVKATMWQPLPTFGTIYEDRQQMAEMIGINASDLLDMPIQWVSCGVPYVIIPVKSINTIRKLGFRIDRYMELKSELQNAFVYAFAPEGERQGSHLHGRMFAPEAGILEDPATGSANGPLGCYVTKYGIKSAPYISEQGFEMGRPSIINIDIVQNGAGDIAEVQVGGQAVMIGKGEIFL